MYLTPAQIKGSIKMLQNKMRFPNLQAFKAS